MTYPNSRVRAELAAIRVLTTLARLELKYRPDQARVPKGQAGGGRFASERGGVGGSRAFLAPAAAARTATASMAAGGGGEVAAAAAPGAAALMMGAVGISRTAGLATQAANGGGVTPILGIPFQMSSPGKVTVSEQVKQECDAAYNDDLNQCYDAFDLPRMSFNPGNRPLNQCVDNANDRYFECLAKGEPYSSNVPLFRGVKIPRKFK